MPDLAPATPTITDWITAIAAIIGIGPIVWGIVKLFLNDKDKEQRIEFLQEQLNELKRQTSEFQFHSTLMQDSNDLLERQINLQAEMFLQTKNVEQSRADIEIKRRIAETKPHFVFQTASSSPERFDLKLRNNGAVAEVIQIHETSEFLSIYPLKKNLRAETGQVIELTGTSNMTKTFFNSNQVSGKILLHYRDADGREYFQNINKGPGGFNIESPYLKD